MAFMKHVAGYCDFTQWTFGGEGAKADAAGALNETMRECEHFATLEFSTEVPLGFSLTLSLTDDESLEKEPTFSVSFSEVLSDAAGMFEPEEFRERLDILQALIDAHRKALDAAQ